MTFFDRVKEVSLADHCAVAFLTAHALNPQSRLTTTPMHWQGSWKEFLMLYLTLTMEVWFHESNQKDGVHHAKPAISSTLTSLQLYYNLPKMQGMANMQDYVCLFRHAINFYGGPGETSHKSFVNVPGMKKTQRRIMCEFAKQTAGQYCNIMIVNKATNCSEGDVFAVMIWMPASRMWRVGTVSAMMQGEY